MANTTQSTPVSTPDHPLMNGKDNTPTEAIKQKASDVAEQAQAYAQAGQAHVRDAGQTLTQSVKDHPLLAVGTAFGLGLAVSLLLKNNISSRY